MPRLARPIALALLLTGCSSLFGGGDTKIVNPPPPGVSYRVNPGEDPSAADRKAQDYCARYGKTAKRDTTSKAADSTIVQYNCS